MNNFACQPCIHRHYPHTHASCFTKEIVGDRIIYTPKANWFDDKRIGFLDIEASNLDANFGIIYCWYIKPLGSRKYLSYCVTPKEIRDGTEDKNAIRELCKAMREFDVIVTYYGTRFDIPYIRTVALTNGADFPVFGEICHLDMYYVVRNKLKLHSNRLEVVTQHFGIKGKTRLEPKIWRRAGTGDEASLKYIYKHNRFDVDILEKLYLKMKPHIRAVRKSL